MDAYLTKPIRLARLKEAIEGWLGPTGQAKTSQDGARAAAAQALPAVDLNVLAAMVGDDPAVTDEILVSFRESAAQSSEEVIRGIIAGAPQAALDAAHKLKSAANWIGAVRLGAICARIEDAGIASRGEELRTLLSAFQAELDAVQRFLDSRSQA